MPGRPSSPSTRPDPSRRHVVVIGNLPPPVGGAAKSTLRIYSDLLLTSAKVMLVDGSVGGSAHHGSWFNHLRRIRRFLLNVGRIAGHPGDGSSYIAINAGYGMLYSLVYVGVARAKGWRIFAHHHSYAYISRWSVLMWLLGRLAGAGAIHVLGDDVMAAKFARRYRRRFVTRCLSNSATMDLVSGSTASQKPANVVRIGYLSNLCGEKGFDTVAALFARLGKQAAHYRFSIAGAAMTKRDEEILAALRRDLGGRLEYFGPVADKRKSDFLGGLDIFVFPTRFKQEAQPFVIYEALAAGSVVIATRRAGIEAMLSSFPSVVVNESDDLVESLVAAVESVCSGADWMSRRTEIIDKFRVVKQQADSAYGSLLNEIAGGPSGQTHL